MPQGKLTQEQRDKQAISRLTTVNQKQRERISNLETEIKELKEELQNQKLQYEDLASAVFKKKGSNRITRFLDGKPQLIIGKSNGLCYSEE